MHSAKKWGREMTMEPDRRIEEIARFNPLVYASLHFWKISSMPEREFLIRLVLLLNEAYSDLFRECCKYHERKTFPDPILIEEIKLKKEKKQNV